MALPDVLDELSRACRSERARLAVIARSEGLSAEDAVDCIHDAFSTFLQLAVRGERPHTRALAVMVRNAARNMRRRHHRARPHDAIAEATPSNAAGALESLERAEEHVRLHACVERLCDTQRAVVTLRMLEERDGEDVAAVLGISRGYVDVLLHRARGSLLSCMTEGAHDP
jgi:RNA polymerase sigma-70 factor (ECF subfamily)